jgi:alpha-glutamyl/putrescinyl thymine pyrophosphorylase clade 1
VAVAAICDAVAMNRRARPEVYPAYWTLAVRRQEIFERRLAGDPAPWTTDTILQRYKFCNTFRASDRVSQFLIRNVIYDGKTRGPESTLLRIILFRLFSKPTTWQALERTLGEIRSETFAAEHIDRVLDELYTRGETIYTSAFILCANKAYGHARKHRNHLALIRAMRSGGLARAIARARGLRDVYEALTGYPLLGRFMAYQLAIDINYSELTDFDENEFTIAGPGAERGIRKCFLDTNGRKQEDVIRWMVDHQEDECERLRLAPPTLFGRPLHAIDCQGLFCELDKYARVAFPELRSNRQRIKTSFRPTTEALPLFYPPKWGLNKRLPTSAAGPAQQSLPVSA